MTLARYDVVVVDLSPRRPSRALGRPRAWDVTPSHDAREAWGRVGRTHRGDTAVVTPSTVVAIDCIGLDCFARFALDWFKSVVVGNDRDGGDDDGG